MLTVHNSKTVIKVNDNPKEIESDNIKLDYEIRLIGGQLINSYIEFDYHESTLKIPIKDYRLAGNDQLVNIQINTDSDWEKRIIEFTD